MKKEAVVIVVVLVVVVVVAVVVVVVVSFAPPLPFVPPSQVFNFAGGVLAIFLNAVPSMRRAARGAN